MTSCIVGMTLTRLLHTCVLEGVTGPVLLRGRHRVCSRYERVTVLTFGGPGGSAERILVFDGALMALLEVGALEDIGSCGLLSETLGGILLKLCDGLIFHLLCPLRGERQIRCVGGHEPLIVVIVPEEELEVLCRVLNVHQVIHKVSDSAWLQKWLAKQETVMIWHMSTTYWASASIHDVVERERIWDADRGRRLARAHRALLIEGGRAVLKLLLLDVRRSPVA